MRRLALAVALISATPALAVYQCGDTQDTCPCGANNPYPCCDNGGNCTWYAWDNACCSMNVGLPSWGNAKQWTGNAQANASYAVRSAPVTNAVSCRDIGTYGHVAYVSTLNGGGSITVKEQNCWGSYGASTTNYASSYFTGGFITRTGQVECNPGDSQYAGLRQLRQPVARLRQRRRLGRLEHLLERRRVRARRDAKRRAAETAACRSAPARRAVSGMASPPARAPPTPRPTPAPA